MALDNEGGVAVWIDPSKVVFLTISVVSMSHHVHYSFAFLSWQRFFAALSTVMGPVRWKLVMCLRHVGIGLDHNALHVILQAADRNIVNNHSSHCTYSVFWLGECHNTDGVFAVTQ